MRGAAGSGVSGSRSDLDPDDWAAFRAEAHAALDDMITHIASVRDRPVWQPQPPATRERFERPLPRGERDLAHVLGDFRAHIAPYATGNLHPRFMGWVHGAGTPVGMVAEMLAAGLDMNCGGRDHVGITVERQIARWAAELFGYPSDASGLFVTGTSMANFLAVIVARSAALGEEVRRRGLSGRDRLVAYASAEAHGCIAQALELAGIGSAKLRRIAVDGDYRVRVDHLEAAIAADRARGLMPFLVVGTAGTVNTGAIDPLGAIADVCAREGVWLHVDGAFGALAALSPRLGPLLAGIERSQSIAFDFHKWAHVPYDAGFLLVRDPKAHRRAFANPAAYLQRAPRGLAAGDTWPCDLGPDLSRGFRALKTWITFETLGSERIGAAIEECCALARYLAEGIGGSSLLQLEAPVALNIVCFGVRGDNRSAVNRDIVMELQERGIAAPSWTTIAGSTVIRAAIVNHRTTRADVDVLIETVIELAAEHPLHKREQGAKPTLNAEA